MQLTGFHHLTAVTAHAPLNRDFYTATLGLRLVKKTVNQDDTSAYHLFYGDGKGSPGTDITFFDWPLTRARRGTNGIVRTGFRVGGGRETLDYWSNRLDHLKVAHGDVVTRDGRPTLDLQDFEGQRLSLVADETPATEGAPWEKSPVPAGRQIRGLGPITISVPDLAPTDRMLTELMNMRKAREYAGAGTEPATVHVYEMAAAGPAGELHVAVEPSLPRGKEGAGGVHHVAFRVPTVEAYNAWNDRLREFRVPSSGPVDRFYFRSLYFREPNGILFELATDGPGFTADEPLEALGENLSLPPFLEGRRASIEAALLPL
jgi:glyoxalase family protein